MSTNKEEGWRKYIRENYVVLDNVSMFKSENDDDVKLASEEELRSMLNKALAEEKEEDKVERLKKIAQTPNASLSILQEIIDYAHTMEFSWDRNYLLKEVIKNKTCNSVQLSEIMDHSATNEIYEDSIIVWIAKSPNCSKEILARILSEYDKKEFGEKDKISYDGGILAALGGNPNCSSEQLEEIFNRVQAIEFNEPNAETYIYRFIAANPACSEPLLGRLTDKAIQLDKDLYSEFLIDDILRHPKSTKKMVLKFCTEQLLSEDFLTRYSQDENCPPEIQVAAVNSAITDSYSFYRRKNERSVDTEKIYEILDNERLCSEALVVVLENLRYMEDKKDRQEILKSLSSKKNYSAEVAAQLLQKMPSILTDDKDKADVFINILENAAPSTEINRKILAASIELSDSTLKEKVLKAVSGKFANPSELEGILIQEQKNKLRKNVIAKLCSEKSTEENLVAFIKLADNAVKSGNQQKIDSFKDFLFSADDRAVFDIDHKAVEYFINHGTPENFEALNNLRSFYGLQTVIEPYSHADPDRTDAKRILFSGKLSAMGKDNPHYKRKHSKAFLAFTPDYSRDYKAKDYKIDENEAFKKLVREGVKLPVATLKEALVEMHMPPETVLQLNATDLCHILVEHKEQEIDNEYGAMVDFSEYTSKAPGSIRENYWKSVAENEQLVRFISEDWRKLNISETDIEQIWENVRESGSPCYDESGNRNVYGISPQIHHFKALKDGGENVVENFMIVNNIQGEYTHVNIDGDDFLRNAGLKCLNSHEPLHEYDNPLITLWQEANDFVSPQYKNGSQRVKVLTYLRPANCREGEHVLYYGGPRAESCCIGTLDGEVRQAEYIPGVNRQNKIQNQPQSRGVKDDLSR